MLEKKFIRLNKTIGGNAIIYKRFLILLGSPLNLKKFKKIKMAVLGKIKKSCANKSPKKCDTWIVKLPLL